MQVLPSTGSISPPASTVSVPITVNTLARSQTTVSNQSADAFSPQSALTTEEKQTLSQATQAFLSGQVLQNTLAAALQSERLPYLAPTGFNNLPASHQQIWQQQLAPLLSVSNTRKTLIAPIRALAQHIRSQPMQPGDATDLTLTINRLPIHIQPLSYGAYGTVFKLTVQNHTFILKSFTQTAEAYKEAAAALFTQNRFADMATVLANNPEEGWAVYEFIPQNIPLNVRTGHLLTQASTVNLRDKHEKNYLPVSVSDGKSTIPSHILVDYGSIEPKSPNNLDWATFIQRVNTTPVNNLGGLITQLPEAERLKAFKQLLTLPNVEAAHSAVSALPNLPPEHVLAGIQAVMTLKPTLNAQWPEQRHNILLMRAASRLCHLPTADDRWLLFQQLIMGDQNPYTRLGAGATINTLPTAHMAEALQQVLLQPSTPVFIDNQWTTTREYMFQSLPFLPENVFIQCVDTLPQALLKEPLVRQNIQKALWYFSPATRTAVFSRLGLLQQPKLTA
jgi:hypothetical protein